MTYEKIKKQINYLYSELIKKIEANGEYGKWNPKCLTETEKDFMFRADEMWHYGETEVSEYEIEGVRIGSDESDVMEDLVITEYTDYFTPTVKALYKVFNERKAG